MDHRGSGKSPNSNPPFSPSYDASIYSPQWAPDTCKGFLTLNRPHRLQCTLIFSIQIIQVKQSVEAPRLAMMRDSLCSCDQTGHKRVGWVGKLRKGQINYNTTSLNAFNMFALENRVVCWGLLSLQRIFQLFVRLFVYIMKIRSTCVWNCISLMMCEEKGF